MNEGIVFVNKGTPDCRASLKWAKAQCPDARIVSVSLANDPFVNQQAIQQLADEEGIQHVTIPFEASFVATKNQNVEKAWEFERLFKGLQYQRRLAMLATMSPNPDEISYDYVLTSLRGTEFDAKLVDIFKRYINMNIFYINKGITVESYVSQPLFQVISDEDFSQFLINNGIEMGDA